MRSERMKSWVGHEVEVEGMDFYSGYSALLLEFGSGWVILREDGMNGGREFFLRLRAGAILRLKEKK